MTPQWLVPLTHLPILTALTPVSVLPPLNGKLPGIDVQVLEPINGSEIRKITTWDVQNPANNGLTNISTGLPGFWTINSMIQQLLGISPATCYKSLQLI